MLTWRQVRGMRTFSVAANVTTSSNRGAAPSMSMACLVTWERAVVVSSAFRYPTVKGWIPYSNSSLLEWPNAKAVIFPVKAGVMIGARSGAKPRAAAVASVAREMVVPSKRLGAAAKSTQN
jgi:hypothetical protein